MDTSANDIDEIPFCFDQNFWGDLPPNPSPLSDKDFQKQLDAIKQMGKSGRMRFVIFQA